MEQHVFCIFIDYSFTAEKVLQFIMPL